MKRLRFLIVNKTNVSSKRLLKNKYLFFIMSLLFIIVGCFRLNAQTSYIQVTSESGVSVFLDNTFKGKTTSEIGGLIIENVSPGSHIIKVIKEGFVPQLGQINVKAGEVFAFNVKPFVPQIKVSQQGNTGQQQIDIKVGRIKIQSLPITISISIPDLGINSKKTMDEWKADKIPIGGYKATFSGNNMTISYMIDVIENKLIHLFVNMINGSVVVKSVSDYLITSKIDDVFNPNKVYETLADARDDKAYKTVEIGNQVWMAENLNYDAGNGVWIYRDNPSNAPIYGRLYSWETAKKVCPSGWHLPSKGEFGELETYLGGEDNAWVKLKSVNKAYWGEYNLATNTSGFSAISCGTRFSDEERAGDSPGIFTPRWAELGISAHFWTSTSSVSDNNRAICYGLLNERHYASYIDYFKSNAFSVRCIKDKY